MGCVNSKQHNMRCKHCQAPYSRVQKLFDARNPPSPAQIRQLPSGSPHFLHSRLSEARVGERRRVRFSQWHHHSHRHQQWRLVVGDEEEQRRVRNGVKRSQDLVQNDRGEDPTIPQSSSQNPDHDSTGRVRDDQDL
ncbi:unnamed protein product [Linum trigynum]|uniref:Uncharacterized protein n=1 Tax=Linum trigynum TaxID=586398 RepID=A0AAV2F735_9ROSI